MPRILPNVTNCVENKNLIDELNKSQDYKICYVKSPAGYGKTTLLGKWLEGFDFNNIFWYSFKKIEGIPSIFFRSFFGGLKSKIKSDEFDNLYNIYRQADVTNEEMALLASLLDPENEMIFVLDDFHNLTNRVYNLLINFIINTNYKCRFVISSRSDIPLCFSDLLINNQVYFIKGKFEFGYDETLSFFKNKGIDLTLDQTEKLLEYTNGWAPAYVSIAIANSMYDGDISKFKKYLFDYFKRTIWNEYDNQVKTFLKTAYVLKLVNLVTIKSILMINDDDLNKMLETVGVFFVKCSEVDYKIIPIINDFLVSEINKEEYKNICLRVADYYYVRKKYVEAINLYSRIEDNEKIEKAVLDYSLQTNFRDYEAIRDALYKVKNAYAFKSPIIMAAIIIDAFNNYKINMVSFYFDKLNSLDTLFELDSIKDIKKYIIIFNLNVSNKEIIKRIEFFHNTNQKISTIDQCGYFPSVIRGVRDYYDIVNEFKSNMSYRCMFTNTIDIYGDNLSDLISLEIELECGRLNQIVNKTNQIYFNGKNNLTLEQLTVIANILVRTYCALREYDNALKVLTNLKIKILESDKLYLLQTFRSISVKYYISTKSDTIIEDWLENHANKELSELNFKDFFTYKTKVKALFYKGEFSNCSIIVEYLIEKAKLYNRYIDLYELYFAKAIIYYQSNEKSLCIENIIKSLELSMPIGFTMFYYEYGLIGLKTIEYAIKFLNKDQAKYLNEILKYKSDYISDEVKIETDQEIKKLSKSEVLVLKLLEKGYSQDDIGKELNIKLSTVKTHTSRIYSKLSVNNKQQAIRIAKGLGII